MQIRPDWSLALKFTVWDIIWAVLGFIWVMIVVRVISKKFYDWLVGRGEDKKVAVYYNRKLIHILAGGLVALLVPVLFSGPLVPLILALVLAFATWLPHKTGKLMEWFQVEWNIYETHFCIMWGVVLYIMWLLSGNPWYGVVPISFMAFGDAATGITRNYLFRHRTKSWWGNFAMACFCVPFGFIIFGWVGALAGLVASIIEHFEWRNLDDNITVPLSSALILLALA